MPSTAAEQPGPGGSTGSGADARPPVFLAEPGSLGADIVVLAGPEGRHAATVRRLSVGERVDLSDGAGLTACCVVTSARAGVLELQVRERHVVPAPEPSLVVVQALPKGDRGQLAVELMTEAGVDVIVPWAAERCVTRWQGERGDRALARWRATAREAGKQARRSRFPEVAPLASTSEVLALLGSAALPVVLDPGAPLSLAAAPLPGAGTIVCVVGPEGGVSPAEAAAMTAAGARPARLGGTVLRTSSAGMVAASVLLSRSGRWD